MVSCKNARSVDSIAPPIAASDQRSPPRPSDSPLILSVPHPFRPCSSDKRTRTPRLDDRSASNASSVVRRSHDDLAIVCFLFFLCSFVLRIRHKTRVCTIPTSTRCKSEKQQRRSCQPTTFAPSLLSLPSFDSFRSAQPFSCWRTVEWSTHMCTHTQVTQPQFRDTYTYSIAKIARYRRVSATRVYTTIHSKIH